MKFFKHALLILLLISTVASCRLFRSDEQNALRDIDKHNRKLSMLYAAWPKFKPTQDSVSGEVNINNPIVKVDTLYQYTDTGSIRRINSLLFEKFRDTVYVKKIIKLFRDKKCIGDSLIINEQFYKLKVTEDSLGLHFLITPKDTALSAKYKQACPPVYCPEDKFYSHSEFWFVLSLFVVLVLAIFIHLKLQK
jgi:hypothetical protein